MNGEKCRSASLCIHSFPCTCVDPLFLFMLRHAMNDNKCGSDSLYIQSFSCTCAHPLLFSCCCMLWIEKCAAQPPSIYSRFRARVLIRCYFHVAACNELQQVWLSLLVYTIIFVHVCPSVVMFMLLYAMNENGCGSASLYVRSFPCVCGHPSSSC